MTRKKIADVAPVAQPEPAVEPKPAKASTATVPESIEDFDVINGFVLENHDKLARVIEGDMKRAGVLEGGLIDQYNGEISKIPPAEVLAHYDKLAGLITHNVGGTTGARVKTGSFWDAKKKKPREKPELMYIFNIGGIQVEVDNPAHLAAAVTTVQAALDEKEQNNAARRQRAKAKSIAKV